MIELEEHWLIQRLQTLREIAEFPDAQRALLRHEDQLLLRFFGEGSSQLKRNRASLAKRGAESCDRPISIPMRLKTRAGEMALLASCSAALASSAAASEYCTAPA